MEKYFLLKRILTLLQHAMRNVKLLFISKTVEINKILTVEMTCWSVQLCRGQRSGATLITHSEPPQPLDVPPPGQPRRRQGPPRGGHWPRGQGSLHRRKDCCAHMSGLKRRIKSGVDT